jgi:hypothetical protein
MKRRTSSTTRYDHHRRRMLWHVEWAFPAAGAAAADQRVPEEKLVSELLAAHISRQPGKAAEQFALRQYSDVGVQGLQVFMKQQRCRVGGCSVVGGGCSVVGGGWGE